MEHIASAAGWRRECIILIVLSVLLGIPSVHAGKIQLSVLTGFSTEALDHNVGKLEHSPIALTQQLYLGYRPLESMIIGINGSWHHASYDTMGPCTCFDTLALEPLRITRSWLSGGIFGRYYLSRNKSRVYVAASSNLIWRLERRELKGYKVESYIQELGGLTLNIGLGYERILTNRISILGQIVYSLISPQVAVFVRTRVGVGLNISL